MKLLVVIVNYRVADLTIDCLQSIAAEIENVPDTHVAVCENGSGDDLAKRIRKAIDDNGWASWCSLTLASRNLGFAGGNNLVLRPALQSAGPPHYVLFLNPDTLVRPRAFWSLIDFMDRHPKVGVAGSAQEYPDGRKHGSAFRFPTPLGEFEAGLKLGLVSKLLKRWVVAIPTGNSPCGVDWVSGASMTVRRDVFQEIGLLDEGYYTYFEDVDFCFNARKAGWSVWYVPSSLIMHLAGQSSGLTVNSRKRRPAYFFEARRRYFLKNHNAVYAAFADFALVAGLALWRLRIMLTGKQDSTPASFLRDSIRHSVFLAGFKVQGVQKRHMY